jgi:hypothetical protein
MLDCPFIHVWKYCHFSPSWTDADELAKLELYGASNKKIGRVNFPSDKPVFDETFSLTTPKKQNRLIHALVKKILLRQVFLHAKKKHLECFNQAQSCLSLRPALPWIQVDGSPIPCCISLMASAMKSENSERTFSTNYLEKILTA